MSDPSLEAYARLVTHGPRGLLSHGDLDRITAHIDDSCVALSHVMQRGVTSLVDVGTGAGLPGIPLALSLPGCSIHLVESLQWKCVFLREVCEELRLTERVRVHQCRAEEVVGVIARESLDAGVCRALAAPGAALEYLAPLTRVGGVIMLWTTQDRLASAPPSDRALAMLGIDPTPIMITAHSELRDNGMLACWERVAPCDPAIPRRVGLATRKPL